MRIKLVLGLSFSLLLALGLFGLSHASFGGDDGKRQPDEVVAQGKGMSPESGTALMLIGGIEKFGQREDRFNVHYWPRRDAVVSETLRIDEKTLILRRDIASRLRRITYEELSQGSPNESFQALVCKRLVNDDSDRLVYWIIVYPRGTVLPLPRE